MEHFSYCVIPRISTQPHVLARRGLCWSPRDLKTSRGRGDWLKLETDCMNLGMLLLDLVTQHIFQYDILRHANWVIYIYTYFYIYIYLYIYTPCSYFQHAMSWLSHWLCHTSTCSKIYMSHRSGGLGDSWFAHVLFGCISFRWLCSRMALVGGLWLWHLTLSTPQTLKLSWTAE